MRTEKKRGKVGGREEIKREGKTKSKKKRKEDEK